MDKDCTKCKEPKALEEFYQSKRYLDGRRQPCKLCRKEISKQYYKANSEKQRASRRLQYKKNPERAKVNANRWKKGNHEKAKAYALQWAKANSDKVRAIHQRANKKRRSTLKGKLNSCISRVMSKSIKNGSKAGRHWEGLVGYSIDQLKKHLEKQFIDGMTWENYMNGEIHVDHIIPISAFNFETPEHLDFKKCWELKNLQPLWATDNIKKNAKLDKPFQPSLKF